MICSNKWRSVWNSSELILHLFKWFSNSFERLTTSSKQIFYLFNDFTNLFERFTNSFERIFYLFKWLIHSSEPIFSLFERFTNSSVRRNSFWFDLSTSPYDIYLWVNIWTLISLAIIWNYGVFLSECRLIHR